MLAYSQKSILGITNTSHELSRKGHTHLRKPDAEGSGQSTNTKTHIIVPTNPSTSALTFYLHVAELP